MSSPLLWQLCGLVVLVAIAAKAGGCALAARWSGLSWRDSALVGVFMNTRGLMELIVLNGGYDLGVIPKSMFFILTIMAVVTTYMTAPLLRLLTGPEQVQFGVEAASPGGWQAVALEPDVEVRRSGTAG